MRGRIARDGDGKVCDCWESWSDSGARGEAAGRAGRRVEDVTIVAVSKTFPFEAIRAAYDAGLRHFGENRVQEWESKRVRVADLEATWHLIGHLQSNKARRAAGLFDRVDSVDSLALAQRLDAAVVEGAGTEAARLISSEKSRRDALRVVSGQAGATKNGAAKGRRLRVLIEVSLGGESYQERGGGSGLGDAGGRRCWACKFGIAGADDDSAVSGRSGKGATLFSQIARAS